MSHFIFIFLLKPRLSQPVWLNKSNAAASWERSTSTYSYLIPLHLLHTMHPFLFLPVKVHREHWSQTSKKLATRVHKCSVFFCCWKCCSLLLVFCLTELPDKLWHIMRVLKLCFYYDCYCFCMDFFEIHGHIPEQRQSWTLFLKFYLNNTKRFSAVGAAITGNWFHAV